MNDSSACGSAERRAPIGDFLFTGTRWPPSCSDEYRANRYFLKIRKTRNMLKATEHNVPTEYDVIQFMLKISRQL